MWKINVLVGKAFPSRTAARRVKRKTKHQKIINCFTATIRWWTPDENFFLSFNLSRPFSHAWSFAPSHMGNQNVNILSFRKWKTNWTIIVPRFTAGSSKTSQRFEGKLYSPDKLSRMSWSIQQMDWIEESDRCRRGMRGHSRWREQSWLNGWSCWKVNTQNVELKFVLADREGTHCDGLWQYLQRFHFSVGRSKTDFNCWSNIHFVGIELSSKQSFDEKLFPLRRQV